MEEATNVGGGGVPSDIEILRRRMEALRANAESYELVPDQINDFASALAGELVDIIIGYEEGSLALPPSQPMSVPGGLEDPVEKFVRELAASSPAMAPELLLPSAYAAVGALTGGCGFVTWTSRGNRQTAPMTVQHIGLGASGVGKSTSLRALGRFYTSAEREHEDAVKAAVGQWAVAAHEAATQVLDIEKDKVAPGDAEAAVAWKRASTAVHKMIDAVDTGVARGVLTVYSDATAEALVSGAIEHGGAAFVRSAEQDILDNLVRYSARGVGASVTWVTDGWDGSEYRRARKGSGVEQTSAFVLSMSVLTQTETFFRSFSEEGSGDMWLNKGLLGRMWVTMAPPVPTSELLEADARARRGNGAAEIDVSGLAQACGLIGRTCGPGRAARLLEGRLMRSVVDADASQVLKKGLLAAGSAQVLAPPVSLGNLDGVGVVVTVPSKVADRLEDLHTWIVRVMSQLLAGGGDRVLAPVLSRLTYHLARLAALREFLLRAAAGEEALEEWLSGSGGSSGGPELSEQVLEDTALRLMPWLLRMHLATLASLVGGQAMEKVRREGVASRGEDTSMGAVIGRILLKRGAAFPLSISEAVKICSRGRDREWKIGVEQFFKNEYTVQVEMGEEGSPYVQVAAGRRVGTGVVAGAYSPELAIRERPALRTLGLAR